MSLQVAMQPKDIFNLKYLTATLNQMIDCEERFESACESSIFLGISIKKVEAVLNRLISIAAQSGIGKTQKVRTYIEMLIRTDYCCTFDIVKPEKPSPQHPCRLPGNPHQLLMARGTTLKTSKAVWTFNIGAQITAVSSPYSSLRGLVEQINKSNAESCIRPRVEVNFKQLTPKQLPCVPSPAPLQEHHLPKTALTLILEYTMPRSKELFQAEHSVQMVSPSKYATFVNVSFCYSSLAKRLEEVANIGDWLDKHYHFKESIASTLVAKIAHTTYSYSKRGVKFENTNAHCFDGKNTAYWDVHVGRSVLQASTTEKGSMNPDLIKICLLFEKYCV